MFNEAKNNGCKNSEEEIKEIFKIKKNTIKWKTMEKLKRNIY